MQTALRYMLLYDMLAVYVVGVHKTNHRDKIDDIYPVKRDLQLA